jgi:uncharacterized membrane protein YsdA (DUF1294 family)
VRINITHIQAQKPRGIQLQITIINMKKVRLHNKTRLPELPSASVFPVVFVIFFLIIVGACVFSTKIPFLILLLYIASSIVTFVMYALDKSAAKAGSFRTQESTLHLLALVGGWPGAMIAQQTLRHKTKKQSFRAVFWMTVLLNCGAFAWLFTLNGTVSLKSFIWS